VDVATAGAGYVAATTSPKASRPASGPALHEETPPAAQGPPKLTPRPATNEKASLAYEERLKQNQAKAGAKSTVGEIEDPLAGLTPAQREQVAQKAKSSEEAARAQQVEANAQKLLAEIENTPLEKPTGTNGRVSRPAQPTSVPPRPTRTTSAPVVPTEELPPGFDPANGFKTFEEFKEAFGAAGDGEAWHHIVEQTINTGNFAPELLHNPANLLKLPHGKGTIHAKISGYYSSKQRFTGGLTVREWLSTKSFKEQFEFGIQTIKDFGGSQYLPVELR
jgi:hypothetical protein